MTIFIANKTARVLYTVGGLVVLAVVMSALARNGVIVSGPLSTILTVGLVLLLAAPLVGFKNWWLPVVGLIVAGGLSLAESRLSEEFWTIGSGAAALVAVLLIAWRTGTSAGMSSTR